MLGGTARLPPAVFQLLARQCLTTLGSTLRVPAWLWGAGRSHSSELT